MTKSYEEILAENEELRRSLGESQELLRAISNGEVDALVVSRPDGEQVFTLEGADRAYRVLIEAMNDGALTITSEGTILFCNRHFAEMVKSPLEKVIGTSIYRFIPQADQAAFKVLQQSLGRDELTLRADDESILPIYISINSLKLSESLKAFCVIVTDLTEQKRKEEIVAAERLARSIIEQATEAVVVCDENGMVIRSSNAVSRILGCDPSKQNFEDLFYLRLPNGKTLHPVSAALHGDILLNVEASFEPGEGTLFHLLLNAGPLKSAEGMIIGCVVTFTDITERMRAEEKIAQQNLILNEINRVYKETIRCETMEDLGRACLGIVESVTGSKLSFIGEIGPDGLHHDIAVSDPGYELCTMYDRTGHRRQPGSFKIQGLYGSVLHDGKSLLTNDPSSHPDSIGVPEGHPHLTAFLGVPFILNGKAVGMIGVGNREGGYRSEDREILEALTPTILEAIMRKRAEDALEKQATLIDLSPDGIMVFKLDGTITFWSQGAQSLYGWTREEAIGQTVHTLLKTQFPQPIEQILDKVRQTGSWSSEFAHHAKDGRQVIVRSRWQARFDDQGNLAEIIESNVDITERKRAEEELQETRDYLESLIDYANAPIIVWDPSFKITRFNRAFERLTGMRSIDALGEHLSILFPESSRDESLDHIRRALTGEHWEAVEIPILKANGSIRTVLWNSANIYARNDKTIIATIAQGQDITDRKLAEEDLRKARDELEQRVRERTHELLQAKEAAEAAAQAKSDFMANMSHEIRTPMNAVIGMTSLLLDDETLNPEQRDFIETIRMSGDALMVIINDILDFSKMQEDRVILEDQAFDLRNCVEEAIDLVAGKASEKGLNLACIVDKRVPDVIIGDPNRLRQVLSNLLSNAVKFTETGEVKTSVFAQKLSDTYEIRFAVQDTGIGISRDQMDLLFQPFSQVDATVTRNYGGTGLGLVISKKLVELMEGEIWAESESGKGSTFYFTIKAETAQDDSNGLLFANQPQLVGKHVLIVNDNRTNRRILGAYAYSWGMVPLVASTSREALDWIRRRDAFDVAILDMDMPDIDGLKMANEIRKYNKTLPLVMLTSIGQHIPIDHAYLTKPIKPSQLQRVLANIISTQLSRKSDRAKAAQKEIQMSSLRILLAEDNVTSQKVAKQMLKRLGYRADAVSNGIEALQALERQPYDLVLMDLKMPEMDGLEATLIIRQRWPDNGPKIVAVTAYALQGDREKCIEAGMDDYISKPIKVSELAEVLRKYQTTEIP